MGSSDIHEVLTTSKAIAIVGVSDKPDRPSHGVAEYLLHNSQFDLFFVNPAITQLFGRPVYPNLTEAAAVAGQIDVVDVFRKVEDMGSILDEAIAIGAKVFWMQLGLRSDELTAKAEAAGLTVIQDKCIKIELEKL
jgi:uncharacterized protein